MEAPEQERFRQAVNKCVGAADFRGAFAVVRRYRSRYPRDFGVIQRYASVMGDYAQSLPAPKKARVRARAIAIMRGLLKQCRAEPNRSAVLALRNEFYWQTKARLSQYCLGVSEVSRGNWLGFYCQGVGAAWWAYELALEGRAKPAAIWAGKAVAAWKAHRKFRPEYYNQYVHLGLALGVLGKRKEMEEALRRAAALAGRSRSYREFREVRALVGRLSSQR